uniref:Alpha/beta hydrolase fold-3 domain-containing protein n=1 Tax=Ananas comosus var. bracteatus TaxID=296719 RepID=A0A6V7P3C0_ANACO|nr:unnamed protein product [Ananas comosus var. bracteatus]
MRKKKEKKQIIVLTILPEVTKSAINGLRSIRRGRPRLRPLLPPLQERPRRAPPRHLRRPPRPRPRHLRPLQGRPLHPDSPLPSARLYLPRTLDDDAAVSETKPKLLPVLVYIHGGGFVAESAASPTYHAYLNALASRAQILVVSVEYRRAPEHPLPRPTTTRGPRCAGPRRAPTRGSPSAATSRASSSAGTAPGRTSPTTSPRGSPRGFRAQDRGLDPDPPVVLGEEEEEEIGAEEAERRRRTRKGFWDLVSPGTEVAKDPRLNPMAEGEEERLRTIPCERVMVAVAEKDPLRERGREYCEGLKRSGFEGEWSCWSRRGGTCFPPPKPELQQGQRDDESRGRLLKFSSLIW